MPLLLPFLLACVDERACTDMAVYSTTVSVRDASGAPVEGATLTYTVDGEEPPLPCQELSEGRYVCGLEASGHFVIRASKDGYDDASAEVDVGADECHPIPEAVTLTLHASAADCTDAEVPSIVVHLAGSGGQALTDPQVAYTFGDTAAPIACESADGDTWQCDHDNWGDYTVTAVADAHVAQRVAVTVEPDANACHPVTQELDVLLDWLPD
jgi:hypothetical protein